MDKILDNEIFYMARVKELELELQQVKEVVKSLQEVAMHNQNRAKKWKITAKALYKKILWNR